MVIGASSTDTLTLKPGPTVQKFKLDLRRATFDNKVANFHFLDVQVSADATLSLTQAAKVDVLFLEGTMTGTGALSVATMMTMNGSATVSGSGDIDVLSGAKLRLSGVAYLSVRDVNLVTSTSLLEGVNGLITTGTKVSCARDLGSSRYQSVNAFQQRGRSDKVDISN